jgi:hypothetical protein
MRIVNFILAIMFLVFAFLQVNDPDPVLWILIYGSMSVVCIMAIFEYYHRILILVLAVLFLIYCYILLPGVKEWLQQEDKSVLFDEGMKMQHLFVEEAREFLGLVISLLVLLFYFLQSARKKSA